MLVGLTLENRGYGDVSCFNLVIRIQTIRPTVLGVAGVEEAIVFPTTGCMSIVPLLFALAPLSLGPCGFVLDILHEFWFPISISTPLRSEEPIVPLGHEG